MSDTEHFDVAIIGAGIVGQVLAAALARSGLSIAVVERDRPQPPGAQWHFHPGGEVKLDARVSSLSLASQRILSNLGAWAHVPESRVCAYRNMEVWDGEGLGNIQFGADEIHAESLGAIVENRFVAGALARVLEGAGQVRWFTPDALQAINHRVGQVRELTLESGRTLMCTLLVGADGGDSVVRRLSGLRVREWSYEHQAIACTVRTELRHDRIARQCFRAEGPLAFLPLASEQHPEQYCSIVWSNVPEKAAQLQQLGDEEFCLQLADALEHRLGRILFADRRVSFPLRQCHAVQYVQPGLALIGDAAHVIHPLAGQGVNLGILDAAVLAEELMHAQSRGIALDDMHVLQRYQRRRKAHNLAMMGAMEGFKRLFAAEAPPLRWLRGTGMQLLGGLRLPKQVLIRQACGLDGDLPKLAALREASATGV